MTIDICNIHSSVQYFKLMQMIKDNMLFAEPELMLTKIINLFVYYLNGTIMVFQKSIKSHDS